ncbi:MAG TPA: hypothetical protein VE267_02340 [Bradyrhizobium sp.]|nr:hypothetical protein [Bradyrhizobium sp.]
MIGFKLSRGFEEITIRRRTAPWRRRDAEGTPQTIGRGLVAGMALPHRDRQPRGAGNRPRKALAQGRS